MPTAVGTLSKLDLFGLQPNVNARLDYTKELTIVAASIQEPLARVEVLIREQLSSCHEDVDLLLQYVAELGGKRLRPMLALLSAQAVGKINEDTIRLAAVVELVHTATLVHDDVLDNAELRRHRPTLHRRSNTHASILIGDWLFTQAYALANEGESTIPGRWVAKASKEVCEGEVRQNISIGKTSLSIDDYLMILRQKTGSLCAVSCQLGAWSAGGNVTQCKAFEDFGLKLGVAFQIHDDWLDYWGEGVRIGKTVGGDFASGKMTLPLIRLLKIASKAEHNELMSCFATRSNPAFLRVKELLDHHQLGEATRDASRQQSREAIECLNSIASTSDCQFLERLAMSAVERSA